MLSMSIEFIKGKVFMRPVSFPSTCIKLAVANQRTSYACNISKCLQRAYLIPNRTTCLEHRDLIFSHVQSMNFPFFMANECTVPTLQNVFNSRNEKNRPLLD